MAGKLELQWRRKIVKALRLEPRSPARSAPTSHHLDGSALCRLRRRHYYRILVVRTERTMGLFRGEPEGPLFWLAVGGIFAWELLYQPSTSMTAGIGVSALLLLSVWLVANGGVIGVLY